MLQPILTSLLAHEKIGLEVRRAKAVLATSGGCRLVSAVSSNARILLTRLPFYTRFTHRQLQLSEKKHNETTKQKHKIALSSLLYRLIF